jgi:hypothetical protein
MLELTVRHKITNVVPDFFIIASLGSGRVFSDSRLSGAGKIEFPIEKQHLVTPIKSRKRLKKYNEMMELPPKQTHKLKPLLALRPLKNVILFFPVASIISHEPMQESACVQQSS